jgi:hypothetical protein
MTVLTLLKIMLALFWCCGRSKPTALIDGFAEPSSLTQSLDLESHQQQRLFWA